MPGAWERLASHEGGTIFSLATAPTHDRTTRLFAATAVGLFSTTDVTHGWQAAPVPLPLLSTVVPSAHFATNDLLFTGTQGGFFRSPDAGRTWQQTLSGGHVLTIAAAPGDGQTERVFIGTETDGILCSDDGGSTWAPANPGLLDLTVLALVFSPDVACDQTGFAATASGLCRTRNGGRSWREVALPLDEPAVQCLAISPGFPRDRIVFAGTEADGLWRSDDGGTNWQFVPGLSEGGVSAIAFSSRYPASRYVAAATSAGVSLSVDGGATWQLRGDTAPVLTLVFVPRDDGELLVAGYHRAGAAYLDAAAHDERWTPANRRLGATLLTDVIASPAFARDRTLFVTGPEAGIHVSHDGGHTWHSVAGDFADATIHRVTVSANPTEERTIIATTDAGVYRSSDDGAHWEPVAARDASAVEAVARQDGQDARSPLAVGAILPTETGEYVTVTALATAPDRRAVGPLFVATSAGVYRSRASGDSFVSWNEGLGAAPVLALAVTAAPEDGALVVFALGLDGTIWRRVAERPHHSPDSGTYE